MRFSLKKKTLFNISAIGILSMILLSGALAFSGNTFASNATMGSNHLPTAAGYEVSGAAGSFTRIKGSWVVPTISCSTGQNAKSNESIALDGLPGSVDAMYVGTYSNCVNGVAQYGAYTYFNPATHNGLNLLNLVVKPGDTISAQGKWDAKTHGWHSQVIDVTTNILVKSNGAAPKAFKTAQLSTASFLVGMQAGTSLANYNKVMLGQDNTNVKASCIVSVAGLGKDESIGALAQTTSYNVVQITQEDSGLKIMATPSALSSDGTSFTVNWVASN